MTFSKQKFYFSLVTVYLKKLARFSANGGFLFSFTLHYASMNTRNVSGIQGIKRKEKKEIKRKDGFVETEILF